METEDDRDTKKGDEVADKGKQENQGALSEAVYRSAEVAAFFERFNYFRKPMKVRNPYGAGWLRKPWFAGDRIVQDVLDGRKTIGLLANHATTFMSFDIDTPGKPEEEGVSEVAEELEREIEEAIGNEEVDEETKERWRIQEEETRNWDGWKVLEDGMLGEELRRAFSEIEVPSIGIRGSGRGIELSPELKEAAQIVKGCCNVEPSLVVRSPHGVHLYWCLSEPKKWTEVKESAQRVQEEAQDRFAEIGIEREIEVLPTPRQELRVPRKDRLLEPGSLEPMGRPVDGEALWRGLTTFRLEEIVKESVLERKLGEHRGKVNHGAKRGQSRKPKEPMSDVEKDGLRERVDRGWEAQELPVEVVRGLEGGDENERQWSSTADEEAVSLSGQPVGRRKGNEVEDLEDELRVAGSGIAENGFNESREEGRWQGKKPKSREEVERAVMPFRDGETNEQLIAMVEAGKRSGMSVADVEAWVWEWIEKSRREGYTGVLGENVQEVGRRVAALYERANVAVGSRERWLELWKAENGKYPRNEVLATRMAGELGKVLNMAPQRERVVRRFFADLDVWCRVIDDEAGRSPCRLDLATVENQKRRVYPLPQALLRQLYSKYAEIWKECEASGVVVKDTVVGGSYKPSTGRPQYYQIMR